jgi:hypothetical protein
VKWPPDCGPRAILPAHGGNFGGNYAQVEARNTLALVEVSTLASAPSRA